MLTMKKKSESGQLQPACDFSDRMVLHGSCITRFLFTSVDGGKRRARAAKSFYNGGFSFSEDADLLGDADLSASASFIPPNLRHGGLARRGSSPATLPPPQSTRPQSPGWT